MNSAAVYHRILTPLTFIERNAKVYRDVAIIYGQQHFTYSQFAARINCLASALRHGGMETGERVAFFSFNTDMQVTEKELIRFCRSHIAAFKCPTAIEFTTLPKTSTGKIQKYIFRDQEWVGYDRKIQGA
ncbi:AMP-binding protein [Trichormus sp. NMC-1]|uniref:AMP-binding protein n=1 Tax=Trichormus sp. NMC-1 TaxID=1853259 RepID=UPI0008DBFDEE|nr:AMP-binding protein [Trichormus sp. NMC-1]